VDSCTNSRDNFFTISFLWWVSVMKGKQQFTDKISATILQNTWKIRTLSVCCFRTHVCQSLAVARAHRCARAPTYLPSYQCAWAVFRKLVPTCTHALSFSCSRSWFVLCKVFHHFWQTTQTSGSSWDLVTVGVGLGLFYDLSEVCNLAYHSA